MSSHYVYVIVNKINLKLYFGSHSWDGEGIDKNYYGSGKLIKRAVKKYGKENFIIQPIKFYNTVEECRKAEEELLTRYDIANNQYCYNIKNAAVGWTSEDMAGENNPMYGKRGKDSHNYGRHPTEETRKKLSQALKGKTFSEEHRKNLSRAKKGKRGKDATWYGKHHTEEARKKMIQSKKHLMTPIVAIQIATGKVKIFEGQRECARQLNLNQGHIHQCLNGKCKTCKGYTFKYIEQLESGIYEGITDLTLEPSKTAPTPVIAIDKATGRVRMFLSQAECCRVLGVRKGNVNSCLNGRQKSAGGYTFKKINRDKRVFTVSPRSKADINRLRGIAE